MFTNIYYGKRVNSIYLLINHGKSFFILILYIQGTNYNVVKS